MPSGMVSAWLAMARVQCCVTVASLAGSPMRALPCGCWGRSCAAMVGRPVGSRSGFGVLTTLSRRRGVRLGWGGINGMALRAARALEGALVLMVLLRMSGSFSGGMVRRWGEVSREASQGCAFHRSAARPCQSMLQRFWMMGVRALRAVSGGAGYRARRGKVWMATLGTSSSRHRMAAARIEARAAPRAASAEGVGRRVLPWTWWRSMEVRLREA